MDNDHFPKGATTLSMMTFSRVTFSITIFNSTLRIMTLSIMTECCYAEYHLWLVAVMLSVIYVECGK
jgi:hypothetical protein